MTSKRNDRAATKRPNKIFRSLLTVGTTATISQILLLLYSFIVAGEFWENIGKYKQKIDALGLSNFVKIFNEYIPDDEAAQYFEMSDIFVAPYRGGTQSGVLKAALGFGLPVVLTDVIIDEVTSHFPDLCKIVPSQNSMMLANGIEEQLNTPVLNNAEIDAVFSQTWEKMVKAISH